jgi:hypothetical protein
VSSLFPENYPFPHHKSLHVWILSHQTNVPTSPWIILFLLSCDEVFINQSKCLHFVQLILTGAVDQTPALSQGILTSAYAWALCPVLLGASGDYMGQPLRQEPQPLLPLLPRCQHEVARWVITPVPNSSWVLDSKGICWVWRPKGQMSEHLIPHGEHYDSSIWEGGINLHSCILRRRCKSAPWRRDTGSHRCATGFMSKMLSSLSPSPPQ